MQANIDELIRLAKLIGVITADHPEATDWNASFDKLSNDDKGAVWVLHELISGKSYQIVSNRREYADRMKSLAWCIGATVSEVEEADWPAAGSIRLRFSPPTHR
jgi:hypothetical protein